MISEQDWVNLTNYISQNHQIMKCTLIPVHRGLLTNNTLSELLSIKRDITNKRFYSDGYYGAVTDIIADIKYLKNKQKRNK